MTPTDGIRLTGLATHYVGNDAAGDVLQLAQTGVPIDGETLHNALLQYFLAPFGEGATYCLWHPSDLALNEVYHFAGALFDDPESLIQQSQGLARHLHDVTTLPQIKSGELHVAYITGVPFGAGLVDAIALCKTDTRSPYLKLEEQGGTYRFQPEEGLTPDKMDKGCLILNTGRDEGYQLYVTDRSARSSGGEAQFWKDTFLKVRAAADAYHATEDCMRLAKDFIVDGLPAEFEVERVQQAELLNRTAGFFKKAEQYHQADFEQAVLGGDPQLVDSFRRYGQQYAEDRELSFEDGFDVSDAAVKKNARGFKSVLKLDKNFHVYVHGDRERIERGYDEVTGLNYYKIYFEEES